MAKSLKVAVQMDPIAGINIDGDSTFALMLEAQARGHQLWHYHVKELTLRSGQVGYWVDRGHAGRGVATTALALATPAWAQDSQGAQSSDQGTPADPQIDAVCRQWVEKAPADAATPPTAPVPTPRPERYAAAAPPRTTGPTSPASEELTSRSSR